MKRTAITVLTWFALALSVAAQGSPVNKSGSPGTSKTSLSDVRSLVHELQGRNEKLRDLMEQYREVVGQKPQSSDEAQLDKWGAAIERLLRRIDEARAAVVETKQKLDQAVAGQQLPTSLGKDVANAHNDAEAQRAAAEEALAKNKSKPAKQKSAKQKPAEKPAAPPSDDLDGLDEE